jgi:hypothetical protein
MLQVLDLDLEFLQSGEEGIRFLNQDNIMIENILYADLTHLTWPGIMTCGQE